MVKFDNVSKAFRKGGTITSVRELGRLSKRDRFWVFKDISFEAKKGEVFGIIGPNGTGKTTILKLIAKILVPTEGKITVSGPAVTLIDLGAGFHPELSGAENMRVSTSMFGMSRKERILKEQSIIDFSELHEFIDVPVKHYSQGMLLRLIFSVVCHVNFDVLLIDEVIAVGDMGFRAKCWEKIREFKAMGKTIVIVSHNFGIISSLCDRTLYLDEQKIYAIGKSDEVIRTYQNKVFEKGSVKSIETVRVGTREAEITSLTFLDKQGKSKEAFQGGEPLRIRLNYIAHKKIANPVFCIFIYNREGVYCSGINTKAEGFAIPEIEGEGNIEFIIPELPFAGGNYLVGAGITEGQGEVIDSSMWHTQWYDYHNPVYPFNVKVDKAETGIFLIKGQFQHTKN